MKSLATKTTASSSDAENIQRELLAKTMDLFADPTRLHILELLGDKSMYVADIATVIGVKPPTISHHLSLLKGAGIVRCSGRSKHFYERIDSGLQQMIIDFQAHLRLDLG